MRDQRPPDSWGLRIAPIVFGGFSIFANIKHNKEKGERINGQGILDQSHSCGGEGQNNL